MEKLSDSDMTVEVRSRSGQLVGTISVQHHGPVEVGGEPQEDLHAFWAVLALPPDGDRQRVVRKRVVHYLPHGWRRLLRSALDALV